ncbi:MAG: cation:dicarboxylase symporter family transporter [Vampirovibrionales bacterium]|nr:cation:dicarboxylase symporter family transporter [Vampirovibrionales bacterium]
MPSLSAQVLIAAIAGVALGALAPGVASQLQPLSTLFLHLIKMLIAPLLFATLTVGIAGMGDHKRLGRVGVKTLLYFEIATTLALVIGLGVANLFQPGSGMHLTPSAAATAQLAAIGANAATQHSHGLMETLVSLAPTSVVQAMAEGNVLQIVVFSVFFGLALAAAGEKGRPVMRVLESLNDVMFKFVGYVMVFAPLGVFGALAATIGSHGLGILAVYAKLVGSLYFALIVFVVLVLGSACAAARVPLMKMAQAVREPFFIAFTTASSEAALPKAMETMERFGAPKGIVSFVMPTGYSFNLDGSTLYLSLAALFVAQMAGIELSIQQQVMMMLMLMLTSKGVAAVPRASLVVLAGALVSFGLPVEGIAVILGVDHLMDMARTSVNLLGNCVATTVIARWEGVLDDVKMHAFKGGKSVPAPESRLQPRIA